MGWVINAQMRQFANDGDHSLAPQHLRVLFVAHFVWCVPCECLSPARYLLQWQKITSCLFMSSCVSPQPSTQNKGRPICLWVKWSISFISQQKHPQHLFPLTWKSRWLLMRLIFSWSKLLTKGRSRKEIKRNWSRPKSHNLFACARVRLRIWKCLRNTYEPTKIRKSQDWEQERMTFWMIMWLRSQPLYKGFMF